MLRRSFVRGAALAVPLVAGASACSDPSPRPGEGLDAASSVGSSLEAAVAAIDAPARLSVHLVDDETTLGRTGVPYLMALLEGGQFREPSDLRVELGPGYGREGGHRVERSVIVSAPQRSALETFFAARASTWAPPPGLVVRYGPELAHDGAAQTLRWRAYVVQGRSVVEHEHVISVDEHGDGVGILLDRVGGRRLAEVSRDNVGRRAALVVGDVVVADPIFNEEIRDGKLWISSGGDDRDGHRTLARALRATMLG